MKKLFKILSSIILTVLIYPATGLYSQKPEPLILPAEDKSLLFSLDRMGTILHNLPDHTMGLFMNHLKNPRINQILQKQRDMTDSLTNSFRWYFDQTGTGQPQISFFNADRFISLSPLPGSNYQSIPDYVKMIKKGSTTELKTPLELADCLHKNADQSLKILDNIRTDNDQEKNILIDDFRCMFYLGKYFAFRIQGAINLQLFREMDEYKKENQRNAVNDLTQAQIYWKIYVRIAKKNEHNPLWINRINNTDLDKMTRRVLDDINIAKDII